MATQIAKPKDEIIVITSCIYNMLQTRYIYPASKIKHAYADETLIFITEKGLSQEDRHIRWTSRHF